MDNCTYYKFKLINEMSKLAGFVEMYGLKDARSAKHAKCGQLLQALHKDLHRHINQLRKQL